MSRWDQYGLEEAHFQARRSKDPSTKVGACILRPNGTIAATGWNGFPRGVADLPERLNDRAMKLAITLHAEENALLHAGESVAGMTLYVWPFHSCGHCAAQIVQAGIARVVSLDARIPERWRESFMLGATVLRECGIQLDLIPLVEYGRNRTAEAVFPLDLI